MKSILKCVLAFFVFFSMVDLSAINLLRSFHFDTKTTATITMSDVVKVQCDLLQQTKNVVANVCDNIAKDVISLLAPTQQNNVFFATNQKERKLITDTYFSYVKVVLSVIVLSINYVLKDTKVPLFFFVFVFVFLLRYLGLLFTFDGITISKRYKKAYSM
ncbi:MAG: hypothetical protein J6T23_00415 [Elusimicrobia bacterium]|nr:hypothetical protein [Elusimicrobiota bacterium]